MRLHENKELFAQAITAASQPTEAGGLGESKKMMCI